MQTMTSSHWNTLEGDHLSSDNNANNCFFIKKPVKIKERSNDYVLLAGNLTGKEKFYIMPGK